jgi:hypothetical protein
VSFYLGEYRQRVLEYKYAEFDHLDMLRNKANKEELKQAALDRADDSIADDANKELDPKVDKWTQNKQ